MVYLIYPTHLTLGTLRHFIQTVPLCIISVCALACHVLTASLLWLQVYGSLRHWVEKCWKWLPSVHCCAVGRTECPAQARYEKGPWRLGGDILNPSVDFTSQHLNDKATLAVSLKYWLVKSIDRFSIGNIFWVITGWVWLQLVFDGEGFPSMDVCKSSHCRTYVRA